MGGDLLCLWDSAEGNIYSLLVASDQHPKCVERPTNRSIRLFLSDLPVKQQEARGA
jgi:hypothetical protein